MKLKDKKIGVALTGSFCTFEKTFAIMEELVKEGAQVTPIISFNVDKMDTRFHSAVEVKERLIQITGKKPLATIQDAEPIGPTHMFDLLLIMPCTGNTLAKLVNAIVDTPVTMAAKSHLRNSNPLVIAISTNDGLGMNGKNMGLAMNMKHVYFVPYGQDAPQEKDKSLVFYPEKVIASLQEALLESQIQPILH